MRGGAPYRSAHRRRGRAHPRRARSDAVSGGAPDRAAKALTTVVTRCAAGFYPTAAWIGLGSPYVSFFSSRPVSPNGWEVGFKNLHPSERTQIGWYLNCVRWLKVVFAPGAATEIPASAGGQPSPGSASGGRCPPGFTLGGGGFEVKTGPGVEIGSFGPGQGSNRSVWVVSGWNYAQSPAQLRATSVCVGNPSK